MSTDPNETALLNLCNAQRAAKAQPHEDISSPVAACPARQDTIFVVPVRYALAEKAASHPGCQPGVETRSHAMAARRLRAGYLYLWQGNGPLQRFGVCPEGRLDPDPLDGDDTLIQCGTLTGLALNKHQPAWLMYTEYPLDQQRCAELAQPATRQRRMRLIDLPQVANNLQAAHCPPLRAAEKVMAELMPETFSWGAASEHQRRGEAERRKAQQLYDTMIKHHTVETARAYTAAMNWISAREELLARYPDADKDRPAPGQWSAHHWNALTTYHWLRAARQEAQGLWAVLACLDDDLGVLRDIDHEQDHLEISHQQWIGDNQIRLTVGGFVRSLLREDGAEVANLLNYRFAQQKPNITPEQGETLLEISRQLEPLRAEKARTIKFNRVRTQARAQARLADIDDEIEHVRAPMDSFLPREIDKDDLESEVRRYRQQKKHNNKNGILDGKIGEYVDLPTMDHWLDVTAPDHYRHIEDRQQRLYDDRGVFLPRHDSGTWFVNYDDAGYRTWLNELAESCLTAQCIRSQGAQQYADYVRSKDPGALRQLFFSWSPSLETALNSETRLGEILAALSDENIANTKALLSKILGTEGQPVLAHMQAMANNSQWTAMVNRLAPAVLQLKGDKVDRLSGTWISLMTFTRLNSHLGFRWAQQQNVRTLEAFGQNVDEVRRWAARTGAAIGKGRVADIVNSRAVQDSGGLTPLIVLILNIWNASRYLGQAGVVETMDKQRFHDTLSATLYTAAALAAVVDSRVRKGAGITQFNTRSGTLQAMPLFAAIIGALSGVAAHNEFESLKIQIERSQEFVDPWIEFRKNIVAAQTIAYAAQAIVGAFYTYAAITGIMSAGAALTGLGIALAPIILITAILGVIYLVASLFQRTPLQNFLSHSCWSHAKAKIPGPIDGKSQQEEMNHLLTLIYTPQISHEHIFDYALTDSRDGMKQHAYISGLRIDLPGATPETMNLQVALTGDPIIYDAWVDSRGKTVLGSPVHRMRDIGEYWLKDLRCQWIPHEQGQGLRLSGPFKLITGTFLSLPRQLYLRVKYSTPLTTMLEIDPYLGGKHSLAFALSADGGVIPLRSSGTPVLDQARLHNIRIQDNSMISLPKEKP
ncbi:hypothetical protein IFR09_16865 [Pseudomonas syringae]|nr:hypothetical protein [Pseudomonas syringae]MBD8791243.1 hypothetical protein [Pseudomonas syringae]MBD8802337.1 hypothetical protein [Pseudomonas syringae]MBD8812838.1 hypothetical protein [Pseudomonas syringae]